MVWFHNRLNRHLDSLVRVRLEGTTGRLSAPDPT